jgi:hypothetical protein
MALTVTSLNGAVTQNARQITLTAFTNPSSGGISPKTWALVDGEFVQVEDASLSPTVGVVRGINGSLAVAHNTLAPVIYGLTSDFTQLAAQGSDTLAVAPAATYSVNGAITVPKVDQDIYLTKAGVAAMTLASPAADQTNTVRIISLTANAHTITYTPGFYGNTTSSDVATFPATVGAVFTITAKNGLWQAVATADDGVLIG